MAAKVCMYLYTICICSAGIQPGYVITSINGETVTSSRDVYNAVSSSSELRVTLQRGRSTLSVIITPEEVS